MRYVAAVGVTLMAAATCLAAGDVRLAEAIKHRDRKAVTSLLAQKADVKDRKSVV